jgi:hypothetical protein
MSNFVQVETQEYLWPIIHTHTHAGTQKSTVKIQTPADWPQHDRPVTCVIAQQYSSDTCLLLFFHSRKEKFVTRLKNITSFVDFFIS